MTDHARIIRCEDLSSDVNGEIVALHVEKGQCYGMNAVARASGRLSPSSPAEICAGCEEFDVTRTCRTDVRPACRLQVRG
jgi:hypothetical protein